MEQFGLPSKLKGADMIAFIIVIKPNIEEKDSGRLRQDNLPNPFPMNAFLPVNRSIIVYWCGNLCPYIYIYILLLI